MSAPTIDGEFLPKDPMEMLKEGDFKKIPLLIGSNRDEGECEEKNVCLINLNDIKNLLVLYYTPPNSAGNNKEQLKV